MIAKARKQSKGAYNSGTMSISGEKMKKDLARWGFAKTLWAALARRARPWLVVCQVSVRRNQRLESGLKTSGEVKIKLASREELLRAAKEMPSQLSRNFIDSALSSGLCVAAFVDSKLVAFSWSAFTQVKMNEELWVGFDWPYRYAYKAYTHPEHRGRGIIEAILYYSDDICLDRGFTHSIAYVETDNYPSISAGSKLGNRRVGYVGYLRLFRRSYPFRTRGAKKHSFRFYRRDES
jgi:GNAT superfamily N-acetyltransferase